MRLKSITAVLLMVSVHGFATAAETEEVVEPEFAKEVVIFTPSAQIEAARKLTKMYCQQVTTEDGKGSDFGNWRSCYVDVMRTYLAQLVAETAPKVIFREVEVEKSDEAGKGEGAEKPNKG